MAEQTARELKQRFLKVFTDNDREAQSVLRLLFSSLLNVDYSQVNFALDQFVTEAQIQLFEEWIIRLKKGEPVQHLLGFVEFFDMKIEVGPEVLIPRPETEELMYWIQEDYLDRTIDNAIDFCTGSGCIALGLKKIFPSTLIEGIDVSSEALGTALKNSVVNSLEVDFYQLDLLGSETPKSESYDLMVSNPPYIPIQEKETMDKTVINFEPNLALFVENHQPLVFYERIADLAKLLLKKDGAIYLELHEDLALETLDLYREKGFSNVTLRKDLQGKNRMLCVRY